MHEDVSASAIGRVSPVGVSDEMIYDVSFLSDMIEIRNSLKHEIFVAMVIVITDITVF